MKLVVGLGNPGPEYARHRHNVGFMVVDELLRRASGTSKRQFKGEFARTTLAGQSVVLLKPMTFMNLSGHSVGPCAHYFDVVAEDTIVVHDDLDLDYGDIRVKLKGGHGGHNGLRSIFEHYSPGDFTRIRFGIGRPPRGTPTSHVLSAFSADERIDLDLKIERAADAVEAVLRDGVVHARDHYNRRKKAKPEAQPEETGT